VHEVKVVLLDKTEPTLNHCVAGVRAVKQDLRVNDAAYTVEAQKMREANKPLIKRMHLFANDCPFELPGVEETTSHGEKA
jgi:hypothetical protein